MWLAVTVQKAFQLVPADRIVGAVYHVAVFPDIPNRKPQCLLQFVQQIELLAFVNKKLSHLANKKVSQL